MLGRFSVDDAEELGRFLVEADAASLSTPRPPDERQTKSPLHGAVRCLNERIVRKVFVQERSPVSQQDIVGGLFELHSRG